MGLVVLGVGSEALVRGSTAVARQLKISAVVVGLTVVAYGTSLPEAVVSVVAAQGGKSGVCLGNVIGSNIANIGLILGVGALIRPYKAGKLLFKFDLPMLLTATGLFWLLLADGVISRGEGVLLLFGSAAFTYWNYKHRPKELEEEDGAAGAGTAEAEPPAKKSRSAKAWAAVLLGFVGLVVGAELMVENGVAIARAWGLGETVIGLTLIALGTSLPELATSVTAALHKAGEVSLGNAVGSNIFNLLFVVGLAAVVAPVAVPRAEAANVFGFQLPIMALFAVALVPLFLTGKRMGRAEGLGLLAAYALYIVVTFATGRPVGG